jgi:hypothetical protein
VVYQEILGLIQRGSSLVDQMDAENTAAILETMKEILEDMEEFPILQLSKDYLEERLKDNGFTTQEEYDG